MFALYIAYINSQTRYEVTAAYVLRKQSMVMGVAHTLLLFKNYQE